MFTLNFEYLCTHKSKYAEEKDTEHFTLEDIDFNFTLNQSFDISYLRSEKLIQVRFSFINLI